MKYHVNVYERIRYGFDVEADSYDEAMDIAINSYSDVDPATYDCDVDIEEAE